MPVSRWDGPRLWLTVHPREPGDRPEAALGESTGQQDLGESGEETDLEEPPRLRLGRQDAD